MLTSQSATGRLSTTHQQTIEYADSFTRLLTAAGTAGTHRSPPSKRGDFIKQAGFGGLSLAGLFTAPIAPTVDYATQRVRRASSPSDLKITDMRYAVVMNGGGRCPIIRIDTNQGIHGLGEVRDGANWRYALFLKSRCWASTPATWRWYSSVSSSLATTAGRPGAYVRWKWPCGISPVRPTGYPLTNFWVESTATGTPVRRHPTGGQPRGVRPPYEGARRAEGVHLP